MNSTNVKNNNQIHLLHLSPFEDGSIELFEPRVPSRRNKSEDGTIPRICTSTSIEGCIIGHPHILYRFYEYPNERNSCPYEAMSHLHFLLEAGKGGMLLRVYHFEVDAQAIRTPDLLFENGLVNDARESQEHWLMENSTPASVSYLLLESIKKDEATGELKFEYSQFDSLDEIGTPIKMDDFYFLMETSDPTGSFFNHQYSVEEAREIVSRLDDVTRVYEEKRKESEAASVHAMSLTNFGDVHDEDLPF